MKIKRKMKKVVIPKKTEGSSYILMTCEDHKDYKAIYPPKVNCLICWKIYATRLRLQVKALKITLKELKNVRRK